MLYITDCYTPSSREHLHRFSGEARLNTLIGSQENSQFLKYIVLRNSVTNTMIVTGLHSYQHVFVKLSEKK